MNATIQTYLDEISQTKAEKTVADYSERLKRFSDYMNGRTEFTRQVAVGFLFSLRHKKFGSASISLHQATLKAFYAWLAENGDGRNLLEGEVIPSHVSPVRGNDFIFTEDEYRRLRSWLLQEKKEEWFLAVIIAKNTGLRLGDVVNLRWENVNLEEKKITVTPHKTKRFGKVVEVPITDELFGFLIVRDARDPLILPALSKLYGEFGSGRLSTEFGRFLDACGIIGKSFHSFRHGLASKLLNKNVPIAVVSSITGQTMKTLQRYSHVSVEEKRQWMAA